MNQKDFESVVQQVLSELPSDLRQKIMNVAIVVEESEGVPLTERTSAYGLVPPDKISIYRQPILAACRNAEEIRAMIGKTLRHEIAHYFGIDDERLEELGAY
jgi:predicted Zn-dependent protease with MMP-like domain